MWVHQMTRPLTGSAVLAIALFILIGMVIGVGVLALSGDDSPVNQSSSGTFTLDAETHTITDPNDPGFNACYVVGQESARDYLQLVNSTDASTVTIGAVSPGVPGPGSQITSMSFQPGTAVLFGVDRGAQLGTLDLDTGEFTASPSSFGIADGPQGAYLLNNVDGIEFDPFDGTLYAVHSRPNNLDLLFKVDPATGERIAHAFGPDQDYIVIQDTAGAPGNDDIDAIAISPDDGELYGMARRPGASDNLISINLTTGASTLIGPVGVNNLEGMSFDMDGNLYATSTSAGGSGAGNTLYALDIDTGLATLIGHLDLSKYEAIACGMGGPSALSADLGIDKTANRSAVPQGDHVSFDVTVTNHGPDDTDNVEVEDTLPEGLTYVSSTTTQGTYDHTTGSWSVGALANQSSATLTIIAEATGEVGSSQVNTANITASDVDDPNPGNDSAFAVVTITDIDQADLSLTKVVDDLVPPPGGTLNYTISVTNIGPQDATGVTVEDDFPEGLNILDQMASHGSYNVSTGIWEIGDLPVDDTATLVLTAEVTASAGTTLTNTAEIIESQPEDPTLDDRFGNATVTVTAADLAVTKTVSDENPTVGDIVDFTMTVENLGPSTATNIVAVDELPDGLEYVDHEVSQIVYDPESGIWTVGDLPTGMNATLTIQAIVSTSDEVENTVEITLSDQYDPDLSNNIATVVVTPTAVEEAADLSITKTVDETEPVFGETVTFTLTVTNHGPDDATNVTAIDTLPEGLTFVDATPSGDYDAETGIWTIGSLAVDETVTLTIQAEVATLESVENIAAIHSSDQLDPNLDNNTDSVVLNPVETCIGGFELLKMHVDGPVQYGDRVHVLYGIENICETDTQEVQLLVNGVVVDSNVHTLDQFERIGMGDHVGDRVWLVWSDAVSSEDGWVTFEVRTNDSSLNETLQVFGTGDREYRDGDRPIDDDRRERSRSDTDTPQATTRP